MFVCKDASIQPLFQLYPGPYRVLSCQDKFFSLEIGFRQDNVSVDQLKPVLGPVLNPQQPPQHGLPLSSALVSPPVLQDPGLNPFKEFLPRSAPSLQSSSRPPWACPWSWPPVLDLVPALCSVLEAVSAPVRRNPRRLA